MVTHPMRQGTYRVSSGYGPRWGTFHAGLDFAAPIGTPIYAAADGVVVEGRERYNVAGFGSWIWLDCQDSVGKDFIYGHVKHDGILVKAGDRVRAGQQIGVVGNEGESTGPHTHFEVWGSPGRLGGAHQDPAPYLAGAAQPGEAVARPVGKQGGTIYGIDISEHNDGLSCARAAREGIDFAIIRTTDGTYKDRCYRSHLDDAESAGLITAAYHYLRNPSEGTTVAQQVQAALEVMGDAKRPMWLDCETPAGLHVNHIREAKRLFEAAGVRVIGCYSYVPYWEGSIAPSEPATREFGAFWVAAYGQNRAGAPAGIYPGNGASQWDYPLGNQKPALWQYGSNAQVAGYSVDINAYRGSRDELRALFYGGKQHHEGDEMTTKFFTDFLTGYLGPQIKAIQEIWTQLRGPGGKGWAQLGQNAQGQNLTPVDALAAIRQQLSQIQADVNEIKRGKK
ncbi:peptidoglycan DD-metalloendopeptidase family protein [Corynebacterium striatum]|uniref:peptidoglycan DD-metalloendopeptidase family protein n=1 Tax=Corynebacterium striatum TaxID=43770 RepID=UPI003B63BFAB